MKGVPGVIILVCQGKGFMGSCFGGFSCGFCGFELDW